MSRDARLGRMIPALSAKERGILMLRSYKGEVPEDPLLRTTTQPQTLERTKRRVLLLHELVSVLTECVLQEPDAELLADVRRYLDRVGRGGLRMTHGRECRRRGVPFPFGSLPSAVCYDVSRWRIGSRV